MSIWRRIPVLLIARRNLSRAQARSALAILGIVIGVIAIAALGVFGTTLQASLVGSLGDIGNEIIVSPAFEEGIESLSDRDIREIRRAAGEARVVPLKTSQEVVTYGRERTVVTVYGTDNPDGAFTADGGRIPDPLRSGALVGASLADRLGVAEGNSIRVGGRAYRVRAVLEEQSGFSPVNPNAAVIVPASAIDQEGYAQVIVTAENGVAANRTAVRIREALNQREQRVTVFELGQITEQIGEAFGAVNTFLIGIGAISLLVAGVSIFNVMLMSAIERREEIGVLRAVGYQRMDILKIMLSEALLMGAIGGFIGMVFALVGGIIINQLLLNDWTAIASVQNALYIGAAFAFGTVTAIISGLYPAYKAANERPVDALRK